MPLSPSALIRGIVSRVLPAYNPDAPQVDVPARFGRYNEVNVLSYVRKQHMLADEGTYFLTNNAQTGILSSAATGFVATTPAAIWVNADSPTNVGAKRMYLDYLDLVTTVVGSAASGLVSVQAALVIDSGNRYSSGGTNLSSNIVSPNFDITPKSIGQFYFGAITATAATASARTVVGLRVLRPTVSATVADVVAEVKHFNFGGVEAMLNGSLVVANANMLSVPFPPIVIGPNQSALLYIWQSVGGTNVAATYAAETGWFER